MTMTIDNQILKTEVPEFFTDSWEDVKNNEKLLIIFLWQAINACNDNDADTREYIKSEIEAARECASTLTASTIEECKQAVLRMVSKAAAYA